MNKNTFAPGRGFRHRSR